ncbi:MAG: hypothetical protein HC893_15345 [Chloroflexaceae bacterium]|nr:hypothetical protein [Chloroflexaceae bacterium]
MRSFLIRLVCLLSIGSSVLLLGSACANPAVSQVATPIPATDLVIVSPYRTNDFPVDTMTPPAAREVIAELFGVSTADAAQLDTAVHEQLSLEFIFPNFATLDIPQGEFEALPDDYLRQLVINLNGPVATATARIDTDLSSSDLSIGQVDGETIIYGWVKAALSYPSGATTDMGIYVMISATRQEGAYSVQISNFSHTNRYLLPFGYLQYTDTMYRLQGIDPEALRKSSQ